MLKTCWEEIASLRNENDKLRVRAAVLEEGSGIDGGKGANPKKKFDWYEDVTASSSLHSIVQKEQVTAQSISELKTNLSVSKYLITFPTNAQNHVGDIAVITECEHLRTIDYSVGQYELQRRSVTEMVFTDQDTRDAVNEYISANFGAVWAEEGCILKTVQFCPKLKTVDIHVEEY